MKPTNLLLNRDCEVNLADFGLARFMPQSLARSDGAADSPTGGASTGSPARENDSDRAPTAAPAAPGERSERVKGEQLTRYVVTRWYRAPELLVQNKQYNAKVDMWSVGCILAEVIGAKAIFPGKDSLHQLRLVVDLLGTPTPDELACIQNEQAVGYIRSLRPKEATAPDPTVAALRFRRMYPNASPLLVDLIARLLQFDPSKRPSAADALAHPYLAAYHDAPEEGLPTPEIEMSFERAQPTTEDLRNLIWQEVLRYHPDLGEPTGSMEDGHHWAR